MTEHNFKREILKRISEIRQTEYEFKTPFWKNCFVAFKHKYTEENITVHISILRFDLEVHETDLLRLLEFLIRQQENRMSKGMVEYSAH
jgi:hypothetical protein